MENAYQVTLYHYANGGIAWRHSGFFEYYQIDTSSEDDRTESESGDREELKATGLHSLWGVIMAVTEKTGWTYHYIMWGISWINIRMMLADAPGFKRQKKQPKKVSGSELAKLLNL